MVYHLYREDSTKYPNERQRVQQAFLIIVHTYSSLRPSSTTRSSKVARIIETNKNEEEAEELAKLRYGDFALELT